MISASGDFWNPTLPSPCNGQLNTEFNTLRLLQMGALIGPLFISASLWGSFNEEVSYRQNATSFLWNFIFFSAISNDKSANVEQQLCCILCSHVSFPCPLDWKSVDIYSNFSIFLFNQSRKCYQVGVNICRLTPMCSLFIMCFFLCHHNKGKSSVNTRGCCFTKRLGLPLSVFLYLV